MGGDQVANTLAEVKLNQIWRGSPLPVPASSTRIATSLPTSLWQRSLTPRRTKMCGWRW